MSALLGPAPVARPETPEEATRDLYEKYGQRVFTFCYSRLRNREEAQDAAQTTFVYVLRSLQRGVEPEFELAWLLKIAFNVCRGIRRSTSRVNANTRDVEDIDEFASPSTPGYEQNARLDALRGALAHLPESQRRAILLREWQGLSYAEIADELGLTVGAVETLIFRARRNLSSRLEHVRSGVFNIAALAPFARSLFRTGIGKLGMIGAGATIGLMPVVAVAVAPALADKRPTVHLAAPTTAPADRRADVAARPTGGSRKPAHLARALNYTHHAARAGRGVARSIAPRPVAAREEPVAAPSATSAPARTAAAPATTPLPATPEATIPVAVPVPAIPVDPDAAADAATHTVSQILGVPVESLLPVPSPLP